MGVAIYLGRVEVNVIKTHFIKFSKNEFSKK